MLVEGGADVSVTCWEQGYTALHLSALAGDAGSALCVCVCVCVARIFRPWLAMQVKSVLMVGAVMRAHLHVPLQR